MILIIDKKHTSGVRDKDKRKIWLFPEEVPDIETYNKLPGYTYCNMFSILGEDEGRYIGMRIGDLRIYLSRPVHKGLGYRVRYELVE